ncbi:MAG: glycosyltransferase family 2 protein [Hyphomicrobiales bacterium]|nr:glycosyltransferase family 2 protein [Hyphomicrobiales bacterium]
MKKGRHIAVIIPALNEEQAIARVIADIPGWVDETIVVDNGSSDRTAAVAAEAGATVIAEPERGYGAACLAGIRHCEEADILVFVDGDYSDHPQELDQLVAPILSGRCDFVVGSRVTGRAEPGALTPQQRFGNWLACKLMNFFWRSCYTDLGPFRAIDARALAGLKMQDRAYGWTVEMQIKAALSGLAVDEVPVSYRPRIGQSKVSGTVKGTILAGITILRLIGLFALRHGISPVATAGHIRK